KFNIKVVETIDWCGKYLPDAIACSDVGIAGTSIVVEEEFYVTRGFKLAAVVIAHEYGHNRGLFHRSDRPTNLMNQGVGESCRRINDGEKVRFLQLPSAAMEADPAAAVAQAAAVVDDPVPGWTPEKGTAPQPAVLAPLAH